MTGSWPHRASCACAECSSVNITTRREAKEAAKREMWRLLLARPPRAPFDDDTGKSAA